MEYKAGQTVGRYHLTGPRPTKPGQENVAWYVQCSCGVRKVVRQDHLDFCISNKIEANCGCIQREKDADVMVSAVFKERRDSTWRIWESIVSRCNDEDNKDYPTHGGAGVKVHPAWAENFAQFYRDMGPRPKGTTLARKPDKKGDYVPGNCEWVSLTNGTPNAVKR